MSTNSNVLLVFLITSVAIVPASGNIPSHINPLNATPSTSNLQAQQLLLINELLSYRSGILISLNKGDIKTAMDNFDDYLRILQENDNVLVQIKGDAYTELKDSRYPLNLTIDQVNQLRLLYEEGKLAYQSNQTGRAIQIAIEARKIIANLSSLEQELIMNAVAQYPGVNITLYQNGLSSFDNLSKEIQKRWYTVELTLFDESTTSLSIYPAGGEFGDLLYIKGNLTLPRNGSGVPHANMEVKLDNETLTNLITDKKGKFNYTFPIPYKKPGNYSIRVDFVPLDEPLLPSFAKSTFFIKPANTTLTIKVNPGYGEFGDILLLSGGLAAKNVSGVSNADITISLDNKTLASVKTDEKGSYNYNFSLPMISAGEHTINADFIQSEVFLHSSNKTTIRAMPTNTSIIISVPKIAYQQDYMNLTGRLITDKNLGIPEGSVAIFRDKEQIGSAIINNGDFYFNSWIDKNTSLGNHTVTIKFNGKLLFLPSENSTLIEIKTKPIFYALKQEISKPKSNQNIFLILGIIGIIIFISLLRKEKWQWINALKSRIAALALIIYRAEKTETPPIIPEPLKEVEIKEEKPLLRVQEDRLGKIYAYLDDLIKQKQFKESISFSFKNAKEHVSAVSGIKNIPQQTHREFYALVKKSAPSFADEFKELVELYETAMYSNSKIDAGQALKAMDLLKKICNEQ